MYYRLVVSLLLAATCAAQERRIAVIAHRGEHLSHTENTLAAFQAAIDLGADYFELDVRTTKDGKLVLMHDNTVDRTTKGRGEVANMTFVEIRALEVRGGGRVPTFDEALSLAEGKIGVYVDCKRISPRDVVDALERHHMMEHSVIYGGWAFLKQVSTLQKAARVMPEADNPNHLKQIFAEGHPPAIAFDARDFSVENIAIAKSARALVYVDRLGSNDNPAAWEDAIHLGADGIQTDHPGELVEFLKRQPVRTPADLRLFDEGRQLRKHVVHYEFRHPLREAPASGFQVQHTRLIAQHHAQDLRTGSTHGHGKPCAAREFAALRNRTYEGRSQIVEGLP
jgi:glycerophosphoryl diester phosphodiesterase